MCEKLGTECTMIYPPTGQEIRRSYLDELQNKVSKLEDELEKSSAKTSKAMVRSEKPQQDQGFVEQVGLLTLNAGDDPRYIGETSAYSIAKAIAVSLACMDDGITTPTSETKYEGTIQEDPSFQKPSKFLAKEYLEAYHDAIQLQYPFMDWNEVLHWFSEVVNDSDKPKRISWEANFFIYMMFALGTQVIESHPVHDSYTKLYYDKAFESVDHIVEHTTIHSVQAYLIMAVFSQKIPDGASVWQTTGIAIRSAVALGLHRASKDSTSNGSQDLRSKVFWSAYGLERMNGIILGRPFAISDIDIDAPVPVETDESRVACHVIRLRQVQSSISSFIHRTEQTPSDDDESMRVQIVLELNEWVRNFPTKAEATSSFEVEHWPTISYHNTLSTLLRPIIVKVGQMKSNSPPQYIEWFKVFSESCSTICISYKSMYLKRLMRYMWLTMLSCFVSGISFLYCVWLDQTLKVLKWKHEGIIEETINACSTILYVLAERWQSVAIYRDTFERLSRFVKAVLKGSRPATIHENAEDVINNGALNNIGGSRIDYMLRSNKVSVPTQTPSSDATFMDDMDKLSNFLDASGDNFLRNIFNDFDERQM